MGFVRNLILNNSCGFYYDDFTATSSVNDKMATLPLKASRKEQRTDWLHGLQVFFVFLGHVGFNFGIVC